ncbi:MAG: NADH-quinone oxidoreductase subunit NuoE [Crocinitomicaceae bacterium]|jgi:NADH-quinone oxidoreductase subunit E|nr:NADH-quinone oxidoreductase subunit NuoE [Crocinitomicaceae bacterium]MDP4723188.1 NADH-quinone oxidoreductase subunit NuoE [Crocinitomicaceae bacterium]MDP4740044.1 NADH-quinone oxidoreductase subunit NuoE [Crocinitomicaceae bacterium]MDP4799860.1 NADH-quinone oxidoreductase subunit NuoE [Crocinitomicaceae bacterium]MDP4807399.1 NADH-quinone oxidoreductase subunit NuoE [Crocinitomicaceae bacterium]
MKADHPQAVNEAPIEFSANTMAEMNRVIGLFPEGKQKSAILSVLHLVQDELGWVSVGAMNRVAQILDIQPIEVYEVATFYTMFHLDPVGKNVLEVCRTGPCQLVGSDDLITYIEEKLDIKVGETTKDGMFTLKTVECLGACGYGPMLMCKYQFYERLNKEKVNEMLDAMREASNS